MPPEESRSLQLDIAGLEAMANVQVGDVLQEILDMGKLVQKKRAAGGEEVSCQQLLTTLIGKLQKAAPLKIADATKIYAVVEKAAFAENEQKLLMDTVDAAVLAEPQHIPEQAALRPQTLTALGNYLTADDWSNLNSSDASYAAKTRTLASRLRKLGIQSLGEQTARYSVAVLLTRLPKLPSYVDIHKMALDFKEVFQSTPKAADKLPFLRVYPERPDALPELVYNSAYADGLPISVPIESLRQIAEHHVPLRRTSKLLAVGSSDARRPESAASSAGAGEKQGGLETSLMDFLQGCLKQAVTATARPLLMQQPAHMAAGAIQEAASHGVSASTLPVLPNALDTTPTTSTASPTSQRESTGSPDTKSMEASPKQDPAGLQPRPRQTGACEEEPEDEEKKPSLSDIEEKAFQALKAKHENNKCCNLRGGRGRGRGSAGKTAAVKAAGKGQGKGRGRGAKASGLQQAKAYKRPAAALQLKDWEVCKPNAEQRNSTKLSFQSGHYHAARQFALKTGATPTVAKEYARKAYQAAGQIW